MMETDQIKTMDSIEDESMCLRTAGASAVVLIVFTSGNSSKDMIEDNLPSYSYGHLSNKLHGYIDHVLVIDHDHCRRGHSVLNDRYLDECIARGLIVRNHSNCTTVAISIEKSNEVIEVNSYIMKV